MTNTREVGTIYYTKKPNPNVDEKYYEPVSFESWKMLRDLEPSKFGLPYEDYVELKRNQFEEEKKRRSTVSLELCSVFYSLRPEMIESTRKSIEKIKSDPFFNQWEGPGEEIVALILKGDERI
jgi:hypothetical protein